MKKSTNITKSFGLALLLLLAAPVLSFGALVIPTSYDMPNGYSGTYTYWDDAYNGSGNKGINGAPLTGGTGDLTDGIVATVNWYNSPGPYVGWTIDPTIVFHFATSQSFSNVRIYFDDADGNGGVSAPKGVKINGMQFDMSDPAGSAPFFFDFNVSSLTATDTLNVELQRNNIWVFASELQFEVSPVPVPATIFLLGSGLAGVAAYRKKFRRG